MSTSAATPVRTADFIAAIRREAARFSELARTVDLDTAVPSCPDWRVRNLIQHLGGVHRWAAANVANAQPDPIPPDEEASIMRPPSDDGALMEWFDSGRDALTDTLARAEPDTPCWSFLPAPTPLVFWCRRQAHETGVHRIDAELAATTAVTAFAASIAVDGLDELINGFAAGRSSRLGSERPRTLLVAPSDAGDLSWLIAITGSGAATGVSAGPADCVVRGPASDLFVLLWNRREAIGLAVEGDAAVLELWRRSMTVRWS